MEEDRKRSAPAVADNESSSKRAKTAGARPTPFPSSKRIQCNCVKCLRLVPEEHYAAYDETNVLCIMCYIRHLAKYAQRNNLPLPGLNHTNQALFLDPRRIGYDFSGGWDDIV